MPKSNNKEGAVHSHFSEVEQLLVCTSNAFKIGDGVEEGNGGHNKL